MNISSNKKIVLVTGGSGLVGHALQAILAESKPSNEEWIFLASGDANLLDESETRAVFERFKPTHVVHLAAAVGGLYSNMFGGNLSFLLDNIKMATNVLHCCKTFGVVKAMSCLSTSAFPDDTMYPFDESMIHDGPPHDSNYGYSYAKRMIDTLNQAYSRQYPNGCKFSSFVPCNIFGPHDSFSLKDGHVVPGLIHKAYVAKNEVTPLQIWGTGKSLRQFIYSKDLARLIVWALHNYEEVEPIIFCPDEPDELTIAEVAEMVRRTFELQKDQMKFLTDKSDGRFRMTANNSKLRKYLPNFKFTPMEQAINETTEWFIANYETARK